MISSIIITINLFCAEAKFKEEDVSSSNAMAMGFQVEGGKFFVERDVFKLYI